MEGLCKSSLESASSPFSVLDLAILKSDARVVTLVIDAAKEQMSSGEFQNFVNASLVVPPEP